MTHDYKRHGTTTLFAALNILDGTIIGRNMQRHRHQEFVRFLNTIEAQVPVGKVIHAVVDNYATHKHPRVRQWLARHPRWTFHFTPTSASWLNALKASSPSSHASGSSAASSNRSSNCNSRSTASWPRPTPIPNPRLDRRPQTVLAAVKRGSKSWSRSTKRYPGNYGFVPHTLSDDGDPLDVLVANSRPILPGAVMNVRPIGVLKMDDEAGGDEKIVAVPMPKLTMRYAHVKALLTCRQLHWNRFGTFLSTTRIIEPGKWVKTIGWGDSTEARQLIVDAMVRANR